MFAAGFRHLATVVTDSRCGAFHLSSSWQDEKERRIRSIPAEMPRTLLRRSEYFSEIIEDRRVRPALFLCIVQRTGDPEILWCSQHRSFNDAKLTAQEQLDRRAASASNAG